MEPSDGEWRFRKAFSGRELAKATDHLSAVDADMGEAIRKVGKLRLNEGS